MKKYFKKTARKVLEKILDKLYATRTLTEKNSPANKISLRHLYNFYQDAINRGHRFSLSDTGFRNYSQFEEDGILLYIFAAIGMGNRTFIDIGAGDGTGKDVLPAVTVESILAHPRNRERQKLFEPIKDWEYIHV